MYRISDCTETLNQCFVLVVVDFLMEHLLNIFQKGLQAFVSALLVRPLAERFPAPLLHPRLLGCF